MWPYSEGHYGESFSIGELRTKLRALDEELKMRLGSDGRMRLSHRATPEIIVAVLDLVGGQPSLEQLNVHPGLIRDDVTTTWEEVESYVDPTGPHPSAARGPLLLTEIEAGRQIDVYTDAPPWEENASPTRSLTDVDIRGGWFVDRLQTVFAKRRVRIRFRQPPLAKRKG